jgi:hypothetical protein
MQVASFGCLSIDQATGASSVVRVVFQDLAAGQDGQDIVRTNVFLGHLLLSMEGEFDRLLLGLRLEPGQHRRYIVNIQFVHQLGFASL